MSLLRSLVYLSAVSVASAGVLGTRAGSEIFKRDDATCAVTKDSQPDWYKRNLKTVRDIYDLTVYPNQVPIILGGGKAVPPGLFAPDAVGRVSPVGTFDTFEDSIEYFFALAPTPFSNPAGTAFYDAQVVNFVSSCPSVASSLVYFRTGTVDMLGNLNKSLPTTTLSQISFWHFNAIGEVNKYQSWIPNLQAWTKASSGIDYTSMQVQDAVAGGLCPIVQQRCVGKNQQFKDVEDCTKQLGAKPFGNFDEAWGDNLACRTIHIILTMDRPDVHCPHVGPTGGGKCVDIDYSVDYFDDAGLFKEPEGSTFTCGGDLQPDGQVGAGPGAAKIFADLAKQVADGTLKIPDTGGKSGAAQMPGMPGATGQLPQAPTQGQGQTPTSPQTGAVPPAQGEKGDEKPGVPGDQNPACESCRQAELTPEEVAAAEKKEKGSKKAKAGTGAVPDAQDEKEQKGNEKPGVPGDESPACESCREAELTPEEVAAAEKKENEEKSSKKAKAGTGAVPDAQDEKEQKGDKKAGVPGDESPACESCREAELSPEEVAAEEEKGSKKPPSNTVPDTQDKKSDNIPGDESAACESCREAELSPEEVKAAEENKNDEKDSEDVAPASYEAVDVKGGKPPTRQRWRA